MIYLSKILISVVAILSDRVTKYQKNQEVYVGRTKHVSELQVKNSYYKSYRILDSST
jgi:hypothetical protein